MVLARTSTGFELVDDWARKVKSRVAKPDTAPDSTQPAPETPVKCPDLGGHPEVYYTGPFCQNTAYLPPDFDPQKDHFFISGILWPDQREIGHRKAAMTVSDGGRNPAVLMAYFYGKTVI